jgi:4-amino-4-deoxy-L-arabinose transferase-like glycosyltransferase
MKVGRFDWRAFGTSGLGIVIVLAAGRLILYTLFNNQYGFHRDELQFFDDGRYLAWGYVPYPPVAPFLARIARELFGPSLAGLRFFSALAQAVAMVVAALMARELGGRRFAQIVAAVSVAIAPMSAFSSATFMYVAFDFLWWIVIAYFVVRLLKDEEPRWWLAIGGCIGLGMLTKYTMAFWTAGIIGGVLLTAPRRHLTSRWLWAGVAVALVLFMPNLVWQARHGFVSLQFLGSIHARDIAEGRTDNFLLDQLLIGANIFTAPLWIMGLYYLLFDKTGKRYRMLGLMAVITFLIFLVSRGRGYYTAPIYPPLLVAGSCFLERALDRLDVRRARVGKAVTAAALVAGGAWALLVTLAIHPVNSAGWRAALAINGDLREELGWPDLVQTVAEVYAAVPEDQRARTGILAGNYGEAGAINLYGPSYGLPTAISGTNTYWLRGYGDPPPAQVIAVGFSQATLDRLFADCRVVARNQNRYGVPNEESEEHPVILLCGAPRRPWADLWRGFQEFG